MLERIIISGFGGQGVLSAGYMIASAASSMGLQATMLPAYGAEMRGGTANCQVQVSDKLIGSPLISVADTLFALNEPSVGKYLDKVKAGGTVFINSSVVKKEFDYAARKLVALPIEEIALKEFGNTKVANVIMIGAYIKAMGIVTADALKAVIRENFERKGQKIVDLNFKALEMGMSL